jgi:hypothetical protein
MHYSLVRAIKSSLLLLTLWGVVSCSKEKKLTPDTPPSFYSLPQGNHSYDDSIVAFNKKYGTYILYRFSRQDFAYNLTGYLPAMAGNGNETYVQNTLNFFRTQCLDFYPESFLKKTMPFKILLASYIDSIKAYVGQTPDTARSITGFIPSINMLAIGWTDSTLLKKTPEQLRRIKGYMHRCYFEQCLLSGALDVPMEFIKLAPKSYTSIGGYQPQDGMIEGYPENGASLAWDFLCYINAITSHTKAELDATILSPSVDVNGIIQQKYDALILYYKIQYGVDLQAIGDHL